MAYPDNMDFNAFDRRWGNYELTPEEEALEAHKAQILLAIHTAFAQHPLDTEQDALNRWVILCKEGFDKAYEAFNLLFDFNEYQERSMILERDCARDANSECDIDAVIQAAESYMFVIELQVARHAGGGLCRN